jgi:hypothetical protein
MQNKIYLSKESFTPKESLFLENGSMKAYIFSYSTGVAAIRVENKNGYFIILPYQGQQIWRANFLGEELVMRSTFCEPHPTQDYLATYGGFLLHCGICAMGVPTSPEDDHPLHGEIPNVEYQTVYLLSGEDKNGKYIAVSGEYRHDFAFNRNYNFIPECRLYEHETVMDVSVGIKNLRSTPLEYMYLCHINFRPVDGSELIYSTKYDPQHIKVHKIINDSTPPEKAKPLANYMDSLSENPELHHKVGAPNQYYDPEICFAIRYLADEYGMAHTLQRLPDGKSFYVSHPTEALPVGVRWISRTGDEDAMGMVLPATSEHLGYTKAKKVGMVPVLAPKSEISFSLKVGLLDENRADSIVKKIEDIVNQ